MEVEEGVLGELLNVEAELQQVQGIYLYLYVYLSMKQTNTSSSIRSFQILLTPPSSGISLR